MVRVPPQTNIELIQAAQLFRASTNPVNVANRGLGRHRVHD
jgi:hypothetical protein